MLVEFLEIDDKNTQDAGALQKAITLLLRHQFIYAGERGFAHPYEVLNRPINRRFVQNLCSSLGYRFEIAETEGWCGLMPDFEALEGVLPKMPIRRSVVLLVCAHLWYEMFGDGNIDFDTHVAVTTFNEFEALYQEIAAKGRAAAMTSSALENELLALEKYHLIKLYEFNEDEQDRELEIRPIIKVAAGEAYLKKLEKFSASCAAVTASDQGQEEVADQHIRNVAVEASDSKPSQTPEGN